MATQLAGFDNPIRQCQGRWNKGQGTIAPPFQICELRQLASHSVNLGTQTCMSYRYIIILNQNKEIVN